MSVVPAYNLSSRVFSWRPPALSPPDLSSPVCPVGISPAIPLPCHPLTRHLPCPVGVPPAVIEPLHNTVIVTPDSAVLRCDIADGTPAADVTWYKDARPLRPGRKYSITYKADTAELEISDPTPADSGQYRCEATNKLGAVETDCSLVVQGNYHA